MKEVFMHESEMPIDMQADILVNEGEDDTYLSTRYSCIVKSLEQHDAEVEKRVAKNIADWLEYRAEHGGYGQSFVRAIKGLVEILKVNHGVEVDE